ncbi:ExbD/TolR family protein [Orenia marismortui]|uniref:Outer membrane transport energization protein ExbD n=1 Tax=Orenia marismortui TaxID=46469 RepID=A0A4R8HBT6_9FIRM|nr:biopolymer transporter ExbD [Orenia marismortui]TDX53299.1 outer membrane transport energization protein ExbD [Orenia marismortui]
MFKSNLKKRPNIQILPMIDVIFFLLVFFMLFTTFKTTPAGLEINLPKAKTVTKQEKDVKLTLNISKDGELYLNKRNIDQESLEFEVSKIIDQSPDAIFIIKADKAVKYEKVIGVMDTVRKVGGYRLALAAQQEDMD